jgi:mannose-6-phosphate isomerase-like protein (cupin superfamily)
VINYKLIHLSEFKSIGPRYNRANSQLIFIHKGDVLIEIAGKSIIKHDGESLHIPAKQLYKIYSMTDAEVLIVYSGQEEDIIEIKEDKKEDTWPKQLNFQWKQIV